MNKITLVMLTGYAGCGKDAAAVGLRERGWERRAFADPIREFLYAQNPLVPARSADGEPTRLRMLVDMLGWERAKNEHPEVRELLQRTGTEAGRGVLGEDVWAERALRDRTGPTILCDGRFPNEAEMVCDRGGLIFRIERPGVGPRNDHPSERALDGWDFDGTIRNVGTPERLQQLLVDAVSLCETAG